MLSENYIEIVVPPKKERDCQMNSDLTMLPNFSSNNTFSPGKSWEFLTEDFTDFSSAGWLMKLTDKALDKEEIRSMDRAYWFILVVLIE